MESPFEELLDTPGETFRGNIETTADIAVNMLTFAPTEILTDEEYKEIIFYYMNMFGVHEF